jgi:hypothetical protein
VASQVNSVDRDRNDVARTDSDGVTTAGAQIFLGCLKRLHDVDLDGQIQDRVNLAVVRHRTIMTAICDVTSGNVRRDTRSVKCGD